MKLVQIYPYNNPVSKTHTKPVVLAGVPYVINSKFYKDFTIISKKTQNPFDSCVYGINAHSKKDYKSKVIKLMLKNKPKIIEVHQDVKLAVILAKKLHGYTKVSLIKHGPDIYNRWHESFLLLRYFYQNNLKYLYKIYGISNYVTNSFKNNYPKLQNKFITLYNSYGYLADNLKCENLKKENTILFVGKPVKIKGIFEFIKGATNFLIANNSWRVEIIGAFFSTKAKYNKDIHKVLEIKSIKQLLNNGLLKFVSNLSNKDVFTEMQKAKILVMPSIFNEPFGLVALEAHLAGCIVISSGRGGLKEISGNNAYYLNEVSDADIQETLDFAIKNIAKSNLMAKIGKEQVIKKFNIKNLIISLDKIREQQLNLYKNDNK